jgi:hypothetical protein
LQSLQTSSIGDWIEGGFPVQGTGTIGTPGSTTPGSHISPIWGHCDLQLGETVTAQGAAEVPVTTNSFGQPVINPGWSSQVTDPTRVSP